MLHVFLHRRPDAVCSLGTVGVARGGPQIPPRRLEVVQIQAKGLGPSHKLLGNPLSATHLVRKRLDRLDSSAALPLFSKSTRLFEIVNPWMQRSH